jgi:hypothetical protein
MSLDRGQLLDQVFTGLSQGSKPELLDRLDKIMESIIENEWGTAAEETGILLGQIGVVYGYEDAAGISEKTEDELHKILERINVNI